jgi:hypothetical protein
MMTFSSHPKGGSLRYSSSNPFTALLVLSCTEAHTKGKEESAHKKRSGPM